MYNVFIDNLYGQNVAVESMRSAYEASALVNAYMDAEAGGFRVCSDLHDDYDSYAMITPGMYERAIRGLLVLPI